MDRDMVIYIGGSILAAIATFIITVKVFVHTAEYTGAELKTAHELCINNDGIKLLTILNVQCENGAEFEMNYE